MHQFSFDCKNNNGSNPPKKKKKSSTSATNSSATLHFQHNHKTRFVLVFPQSPKTNGRIQDLILSLQEATFMAKHLLPSSSTNNNPYPTHLHQIHSFLRHGRRPDAGRDRRRWWRDHFKVHNWQGWGENEALLHQEQAPQTAPFALRRSGGGGEAGCFRWWVCGEGQWQWLWSICYEVEGIGPYLPVSLLVSSWSWSCVRYGRIICIDYF